MTQRAQCTVRRDWTAAATEVGMLAGRRLTPAFGLAVAMVAASLSIATAAGWVRVASSSDVEIFVDAGSLTKDSHGVISVWTKTRYASPQTAVGIQYAADMTRFVPDCAGAGYGIAGGKFLDAHGNVLWQFNKPAGKLQPVPVASEIDAVARDICTASGDVPRDK